MKAAQLILIFLSILLFDHPRLYGQDSTGQLSEKDWEFFPIINYDTDVGFGYGAKAFFYNFLSVGESFDLIAYNSTKGERWYRAVFSIPDIQRRQGKKYDAAFDLIIDYDKWINYLYYYDSDPTIVNNDRGFEEYIREPIEISGLLSRAFLTDLIAEFGLQYKRISCYQFAEEGILQYEKPKMVQHLSFLLNLRYDTRTNFINPNNGLLSEVSGEFAKNVSGKNQDYFKIGLTLQSYLQIYSPSIVFASRFILQILSDNVTYQNKLALGGNRTIRGLPQDRYLSRSLMLLNEELRFLIWKRLGGIIGVDIGNSKPAPNLIINPVLGLRFNMDNFIVRADIGFGSDETGVYFNFGHLF